MFSVVSTLALVGLIGILVPIAIHLFNPSKGKLVWVGQLKLFSHSNKQVVRAPKINRWLLLLLRVMIIVLLTLLLAKSYLNVNLAPVTTAIVSPQWLAEADGDSYQQLKAKSDKMVLLAPGFTLIEQLSQEQPQEQSQEQSQEQNPFSHWALLAELDRITPSNENFEVYVTSQTQGFERLLKPQFSRQINWFVLESKPKARQQHQPQVVLLTSTPQPNIEQALQQLGWHFGSVLPQALTTEPLVILWLEPTSPSTEVLKLVAQGASLFSLAATNAGPWGDGVIERLPANWQTLQLQADFVYQLERRLGQNRSLAEQFQGAKVNASQLESEGYTKGHSVADQRQLPLGSFLLMLLSCCWILERWLAEGVSSKTEVADGH